MAEAINSNIEWRRSCAEVAKLMRRASSVLFVTGAGLSADSGLPTYRGVSGLYENANTTEGFPIEKVLSADMIETNPALCWKYMGQIEHACRGSSPNQGHRAIATLCRLMPRAFVLTQNVDGLHAAVATDDHTVIDIHGDVHVLRCTGKNCSKAWNVKDYSDDGLCAVGLPAFVLGSEYAVCECRRREMVRPDIVLFDEMLPSHKLQHLRSEVNRGFDVTFAVGTTAIFPYIQHAVLHGAAVAGGVAVEINTADTVISSSCDYVIRCGAADALMEILTCYRGIVSQEPAKQQIGRAHV